MYTGPVLTLVRGLLFAAIWSSLPAQVPASRYDALKDVLGLSGAQLAQLMQGSPDPPTDRVLDTSQKTKLAEIARVLDRPVEASGSIALGLIDAKQWPGRSLCYYPARSYASELNLSESQVWRFEQLQEEARDTQSRPSRQHRQDLAGMWRVRYSTMRKERSSRSSSGRCNWPAKQ